MNVPHSTPARRRAFKGSLAALALIASWTVGASAASAQGGFGFHGGATVSPDQGFFGMHYISRPLSGDLRVHLAGDVGFGEDVVLSALHVDFAQWFDINPRWQLYFGGGPSVNIFRYDESAPGLEGAAGHDVKAGFESVVGLAQDRGVTFELRVGSNGSPTLRLAIGYTFK